MNIRQERIGVKKIHGESMVFVYLNRQESRFEVNVKSCHERGGLLGTNIQDRVIRTRKPTPTPIVPAVPIWPSIERPVKAPRNKATAAISL